MAIEAYDQSSANALDSLADAMKLTGEKRDLLICAYKLGFHDGRIANIMHGRVAESKELMQRFENAVA